MAAPNPRISIDAANSKRFSVSEMSDLVSPTSTISRQKRDTGFPEPFSGSTTTLPHPDADLSPDACISQEDVAADKTMKRTRLSFLHKKHKKTLSHGAITPTAAALQSVLSVTHIDTSSQPSQPNRTESNSSATQPKDDRDSIASNKKDDETPPTSPEDAEPQKRKGVFGRWKE